MEVIEFKDLNLKIKLTYFINIIGRASSGKTTLLKKIINKVTNGDLYIDGKSIISYDLDFKKRNLMVCLDDLKFNTSYVNEELLYYQNILKTDSDLALENLKNFNEFFGLNEIMESKIESLPIRDKALIKILSFLILNPSVLGIDNLLSYLSIEDKLKIIKYVKQNKISILNVTSMAEEILLGTDVIVLDDYKVLSYESTKKTLNDDKMLLKIGFELPFTVSLSNGLNYYNLLSKKYYTNKSLVEAIWK